MFLLSSGTFEREIIEVGRLTSVVGPIATFQDLGCVRGLLDEQQTQRANIVNGVFGKDRTCWQEDRASLMVSP